MEKYKRFQTTNQSWFVQVTWDYHAICRVDMQLTYSCFWKQPPKWDSLKKTNAGLLSIEDQLNADASVRRPKHCTVQGSKHRSGLKVNPWCSLSSYLSNCSTLAMAHRPYSPPVVKHGWQWKVDHRNGDFPISKPPFSSGIFHWHVSHDTRG